MPTIKFLGQILPVAHPLTIPNIPVLLWNEGNKGVTMRVKTTIEMCDVTVEMELNKYEESDLSWVLNRAWMLARFPVDLYCVGQGIGYTVFIDAYVDPDGNQKDLVSTQLYLGDHFTAFDSNSAPSFDSIFRILASEPELFLALNDLATCLSVPGNWAINCGRAIETIRGIMSNQQGSRTQQWEFMQRQLNVSKSYISLITDTSMAPRHGQRFVYTDDTANSEEIANRTWHIFNRFLEYKKCGSKELHDIDFRLLDA